MPELENLLQTKKTVFHAYVNKSKKEVGNGSNVHELEKINQMIFIVSFLIKKILLIGKIILILII